MHGIHDVLPLGTQPDNSACTLKENTSLYIQYACHVPEEELLAKRKQALLAGCTSVFSCLVLLAVLKYREGSISIEKREWDLQTVTASDYTIEISLNDE